MNVKLFSRICESGDEKLLNFVLNEYEIDLSIYRSEPPQVDTALTAAVRAGNSRIVQTLIDAGAPVNAHDGHYMTPLMYAAICDHRCIKPLLDAGAEVDLVLKQTNKSSTVYYKYPIGWTPLLYALRYNANSIQPLIEGGANINLKIKVNKAYLGRLCIYPLCVAIYNENLQPLVDAGVDLEPIVCPSSNSIMSPLTYAAYFGKEKAIKTLIDVGVDVNYKDQGGTYNRFSALIHLARHNFKHSLRLIGSKNKSVPIKPLLDAGADLDYAIEFLKGKHRFIDVLINFRTYIPKIMTSTQDGILYKITIIDDTHCDYRALGEHIDEVKQNVLYIKEDGKIRLVFDSQLLTPTFYKFKRFCEQSQGWDIHVHQLCSQTSGDSNQQEVPRFSHTADQKPPL